ncbi:ComEC/Rec2 family competence protein [Rhizobium sp. Root1220]|uniref:ComEC/Rec2 family competence protein n=1 Tax=Rhizobium sp. Root1220 TaxID=1736432 RepID=UPI0006F78C77|nr:ComEC/Rec2 family competence protein [Rhizobium sp. Root1220]KQV81371.1 hypothetical protein ASC90_03360 [Rhizobium sp. Root1220]
MPELKTFDAMPAALDHGALFHAPDNLANLVPANRTRGSRTQSPVPWRSRTGSACRQLLSGIRPAFTQELDHGRFFLAAPVFFGGGAIVWFKLDADPSVVALSAWLGIFAAVIVVARFERSIVRKSALIGLLFVCGMFSAQFETWRAATVMLDSSVTTTVTGRVERREGDGKGRWRYIVAVADTQAPSLARPPDRVSIVARGAGEPFEIGQWLTGRARLVPSTGPALPGLDDFSFGSYFDELGANGFFYGAPSAAAPRDDGSLGVARHTTIEWLYRLRAGIGDRIRSILPGDTGAFAASVVTDERRAISRETTEALRQSGLAHIVAISGLNMALSAGIFFVGLRMLLSFVPSVAQAYPTKKIAAAGALLALTAYYLISGFAVSAERAYIMMAIMLVAVLFDRPSISLRNVALSALLILLLSPSEALGPSFQMSYAATLALVAGYAIWTRRPMRENVLATLPAMRPVIVVGRFFGGIVLTSVIGGVSTALFSIEHFHRMSAYGLPANLLAMPIVSFVIMPAGMLAMLLTPLGLDVLPWKVAGFGLDMVIGIARMVSGWGGNIDIGRLPEWYFPLAVSGFLLLTLLHTRLLYLGGAVLGLSTLLVLLVPATAPPDIVLSEDGSVAAILRGKVLASNRERPPDFIFSQWQRALAAGEHKPPNIIGSEAAPLGGAGQERKRYRLSVSEQREARKAIRHSAASGTENGFTCRKGAWCTAMLDNGYVLTTLEDAAYLGPACDVSDIVVTPVRLRLGECRSGSMLFTGETLRRSGAVEVQIGQQGSMSVTTAYQSLSRPWLMHRTYDWRSNTFNTASPISDSDE